MVRVPADRLTTRASRFSISAYARTSRRSDDDRLDFGGDSFAGRFRATNPASAFETVFEGFFETVFEGSFETVFERSFVRFRRPRYTSTAVCTNPRFFLTHRALMRDKRVRGFARRLFGEVSDEGCFGASGSGSDDLDDSLGVGDGDGSVQKGRCTPPRPRVPSSSIVPIPVRTTIP